MPTVKTTYLGELRTESTHLQSGNQLITDAPTDNMGKGEAFSPTDLVATATGTCMLTTMAIVVICGHILDYFNMVMPGTVGPYWKTPEVFLLIVGAVLFVGGLFMFTVLSALSKLKLIPTGNPYLHESEIYEYPF